MLIAPLNVFPASLPLGGIFFGGNPILCAFTDISSYMPVTLPLPAIALTQKLVGEASVVKTCS